MKQFLLLLLLIITGCSSVSSDLCKKADWKTYGAEEAGAGLNNNLADWTKTCREHKVVPDGRLYNVGYSQGLKQFCTYQNGYLWADEGKKNPQICPPERQKQFLKGYLEGSHSYDQKAQFERSTSEPERK